MMAFWLVLFWAMQLTAFVIFKWGNTPDRFWIGFALGNLVGASSMFVYMKLTASANVNVATALATGGGFLAVQIGLLLIFREKLGPWQYLGLLVILAGMMLVMLGKPTSTNPEPNASQGANQVPVALREEPADEEARVV